MSVIWIFVFLFIATFELALLMTKGELLTFARFKAARTLEVQSTLRLPGGSSGGASPGFNWGSGPVTEAARTPLNRNAVVTVTNNLSPVNGNDSFLHPQTGALSVSSAYTPLTGWFRNLWGGTRLRGPGGALPQPVSFQSWTPPRHTEEDNCLPLPSGLSGGGSQCDEKNAIGGLRNSKERGTIQ